MNLLARLIILVFFCIVTTLSAQPVLYTGWPNKAIPFPFCCYVPNWSPALANLDSFPDLEIIAGFAYDSLYVWKTNATSLSPWPKAPEPGFVHWSNVAAVGDVDGDRKLEIVTSSTPPWYSESCRLHIFKSNGQQLEGWPIELPTGRDFTPVLADLNSDGKLEIIFNVLTETLVYVYDYTGKPYPGWPQKIIYEPEWGKIGSIIPAVGDLDGDGSLEVVAFAFDNLYAWHSDGTLLEGFPVPPPPGFYFYPSPVLSDLERDGKLEIIVNGYEPLLPDLRGFLAVYDWKGQIRPGFPRMFWTILDAAPCVGDLDRDGYKEIVVQTIGFPQFPEILNLFLIRHDGTDYPGWPIWAPGQSLFQITLADVDGDGWTDVVNTYDTCYNRYCYWGFAAYKLNGIRVDGFPIRVIGSTSFHTPAFADVNDDKTLDVAFITDQLVTANSQLYYTYLFKLSKVPYDPSTLLWPQFGHDDYNTNNTEFKISYKIGDPNADNRITLADVIYLANFLFKKKMQPNPLWNSDVNCDGYVNVADLIYLINYILKGGKSPCQ